MKKRLRIRKDFIGNFGDEEAELTLKKKFTDEVIDRWTFTAANPEQILTQDLIGPGENTYVISETKVPEGYEKADDITIVINGDDFTYKIGSNQYNQTSPIEIANWPVNEDETSIDISVTWIGYSADETTRPTPRVQLKKRTSTDDGATWSDWSVYGDGPVRIIPQNGNYRYFEDNVPKKKYNRTTYKYEIYEYDAEELPLAGYRITKNVYASGITFTNTIEQKPAEITVDKKWNDSDNMTTQPVHPDVTFHLFADSGNGKKEVSSLVLPSGQTQVKFTRDKNGNVLPTYDESNGYKVIEYTVTEDPVANYKPGEGVQNADGSWTFTNEHKWGSFHLRGKVTLTGGELKAGDYKVKIERSGTGVEPETKILSVDKDGEWSIGASKFVTFYSADVHPVYHISQVNTGIDGVQYDTSEYDVHVTVENNRPQSNTFDVTADVKDYEIVFKNTVEKKSVANAETQLSESSFSYTGTEVKPGITVTLNGKTLVEDTDYTVTYSDNSNVGTAKLTITGKGNYTGKQTKSFKITAKSIKDATIKFDESNSVEYTGEKITNKISSVTLDGKKLTQGTDYEIDDSSKLKATNTGTYTVKINGIGNYTDSATAKWKITEKDSSSDDSSDDKNKTDSDATKKSTTDKDTDDSSGKKINSSSTTSGNKTSTASGNKTGGTSTSGSSSTSHSSNTGRNGVSSNRSTSSNSAERSVSGNGSVSKNKVSGNGFPGGDIKTEGTVSANSNKTRNGSANGKIENILTPASGYEKDAPVKAAINDIETVAESMLAGDFRDALENGSELEVWVDVKSAENTISAEDRTLAENYIISLSDEVAGLCIGRYLDVNVYFRVDKGSWDKVNETNAPVSIDLGAPESMQALSDRYYVLCIHDGQPELLSDLNNDPEMITVMTKWFNGPYVLLYQDVDAGVAGERFGPEKVFLVTMHDSFDFSTTAEDTRNTRPKFLAISWFLSSVIVLAGYGVWEVIKDKAAIQALLNSASQTKPS